MKRILSLDLARGFTVLFMAPIHAVLLYSRPEVYDSWPGRFLAFVAEGPGAQLLMLLMGIAFVLSKSNSLYAVCKRVCLLLAAGFLLNFVKLVLPAMLGVMPAGMYGALDVHRTVGGLLQLFLTGDILHFAAVALLLLYLVSRLPHYPYWALLLAGLACFVAPRLYEVRCAGAGPAGHYLLQLLAGQPPRVFFPLLPWLVYPLAGLAMGRAVQRGRPLAFGYAAIAGLALMVAACSGRLPYAGCVEVSFYRTYPAGTLYHTGLVLLWLYGWHWLSGRAKDRLLFKFLCFLSRHITLIYCFQWVMLCGALPLIGFRRLGTLASVGVAAAAGVLAVIVPALFLLLNRRHKRMG